MSVGIPALQGYALLAEDGKGAGHRQLGRAGPRVTESVLNHWTWQLRTRQWGHCPKAREEVDGAVVLDTLRGQLLEGLAGRHLVSCQGRNLSWPTGTRRSVGIRGTQETLVLGAGKPPLSLSAFSTAC